MEDKLKEILMDILEVEQNEITDNFGPEDAPLWDSMNNLRLVTAIEEEFNVKFKMDDISHMVDFRKIKELLTSYIT